jgi:hypothetical protein
MIYKICIFLRVKSKQHVSAVYGHHQILCQLRFHYIKKTERSLGEKWQVTVRGYVAEEQGDKPQREGMWLRSRATSHRERVCG